MITVSIIEDDKNYREGLEDFINASDDFRILHSYDSAETALPHILVNPPAIAVVDIKLPGMSGVDLIYKIKKLRPEIQCMVCSFYDDNEYVFNALRNGASGYLLKDSLAHEIISSLQELYSGGAPMSRYIAKKVISVFRDKQPLPKLSELSDRENEILHLISTGLVIKEVATRINLSAHTVTKHLKNIYIKLHVNNRIGAVNKLNKLR
ncbi:MAG: response regulator transcription factor [Sphingobacteriales bacterium]|nr:response regulator transcription factor [Sphingobacteriales bacterium]